MTAPHTSPAPSPARTRPRRFARLLAALVVLAVVGLIAAELVLRFAVGLGDPPLYMLDDRTEYRLAPSQSCVRFGNRFRVNAFSMRSPEPPAAKGPSDLRVLVLGDSIVNGGAKVDQADLATERLHDALIAGLNRPVWVGNASAGSWGPVNALGYLDAFGLFNADVVILVLNSADAADVPGLEAIGPQWPMRRPILALDDAFSNYGVRLLHRVTGSGPRPARSANAAQDTAASAAAVEAIAARAAAAGARFALVLYPVRAELTAPTAPPAFTAFRELAAKNAWPVYDTGAAFSAAIARSEDPFLPGDAVHASAAGQRELATVLERAVRDALAASATPTR